MFLIDNTINIFFCSFLNHIALLKFEKKNYDDLKIHIIVSYSIAFIPYIDV